MFAKGGHLFPKSSYTCAKKGLFVQFFALVARDVPQLDKKLLACQINTAPCKKKHPPFFLDLLLKFGIFAAGLHCSFFGTLHGKFSLWG